jgi:hypothetical protein
VKYVKRKHRQIKIYIQITNVFGEVSAVLSPIRVKIVAIIFIVGSFSQQKSVFFRKKNGMGK